jgi:hypothetical protein
MTYLEAFYLIDFKFRGRILIYCGKDLLRLLKSQGKHVHYQPHLNF